MVMNGSSRQRDHSRNAAAARAGHGSVRGPVDLLTVTEAARQLRVSRRTVERMVARGQLPFYELPIRGGLRFSRAEIEAFVESRHRDVV